HIHSNQVFPLRNIKSAWRALDLSWVLRCWRWYPLDGMSNRRRTNNRWRRYWCYSWLVPNRYHGYWCSWLVPNRYHGYRCSWLVPNRYHGYRCSWLVPNRYHGYRCNWLVPNRWRRYWCYSWLVPNRY